MKIVNIPKSKERAMFKNILSFDKASMDYLSTSVKSFIKLMDKQFVTQFFISLKSIMSKYVIVYIFDISFDCQFAIKFIF
jgi:hypothetical protein